MQAAYGGAGSFVSFLSNYLVANIVSVDLLSRADICTLIRLLHGFRRSFAIGRYRFGVTDSALGIRKLSHGVKCILFHATNVHFLVTFMTPLHCTYIQYHPIIMPQ